MNWLEIPPVPEVLRGLPMRRVGKMEMQTDAERDEKRAAAAKARALTCYGQRYESVRDAERLTKHGAPSIKRWADGCKFGWSWVA